MDGDQVTSEAAGQSTLRLRMSKVDEYQFLTCVKNSLWGSRTDRFKDWQEGDQLIIFVGKYLAGLGHVSGKRYKSDDQVWDNDLFPNRIPVTFDVVLLPEHRPPILGPIRDALAIAFPAGGYGLGILNQRLVGEPAAKLMVEAMQEAPNDAAQVNANLEHLMALAKAHRDASKRPQKQQSTAEPVLAVSTDGTHPEVLQEVTEEASTPEDESLHSTMQHRLIQLGLVAGCSVWIAANDKNRLYHNKPLGSGCLEELPSLGLSADATRRMSLIDVIWLRGNYPLYAFEVEATTSIYSGLLRMSDLLASVPALKLQLFVVAPLARQARVLAELARPTFDRIGLSDYCAYIPAEKLEALESKLSGLKGHVHPSVIETLKVEAADVIPSSLE